MPHPSVDYSLYLVTDSSLLPPGRSFVEHVEEAIRGGVTVVQLREKTLSTAEFIARGRELHAVTKKYNVPLLINDRVDVALAVGCEGLHIGWDDCDLVTARQLLGPDKIIGVSISNIEQFRRLENGAECDYIGVGPVYTTATKPDHNPPLGLSGLLSMMRYIRNAKGAFSGIPAVAIGGINTANVQLVTHRVQGALDGVAVVSAIMAAHNPEEVCRKFKELLCSNPPFAQAQIDDIKAQEDLRLQIVDVWNNVRAQRPMVHHITNDVVKNFSANVCLASGASPIMSEDIDETAELAAINGALIINMGTAGAAARSLYFKAMKENNRHGNPVVFDPVGAGASSLRRTTTAAVITNGYCDVIKGNEGEIRTVAGEQIAMKGVDSVAGADGSGSSEELVANLAMRERNIVVMTGVEDWISDGTVAYHLAGGHSFQGLVTGVGCSLGTFIGAAVAANRNRKLLAALAAVVVYNYAAMKAAEDASGPGSWAVAFVDWIWRLTDNGELGEHDLFKLITVSIGSYTAPAPWGCIKDGRLLRTAK